MIDMRVVLFSTFVFVSEGKIFQSDSLHSVKGIRRPIVHRESSRLRLNRRSTTLIPPRSVIRFFIFTDGNSCLRFIEER